MADSQVITRLLGQIRHGDREGESRLLEIVYPELRKLAHYHLQRERPDHTLQATALVNEAYLRIFGAEPVSWQNRAHFFALAAQKMRQILVDHARAKATDKRGGGWIRLSLDAAGELGEGRNEDLVALDEALSRLQELDFQAGQVVELRFFGGLTEKESAEALGISVASVKRAWEFARTWLFRELDRRR
jgi:RNA polymerase sigma factor (TIGR02999 family)